MKESEMWDEVQDCSPIGDGLPDISEMSHEAALKFAETRSSREDLRMLMEAEVRGEAREEIVETIKRRRWEAANNEKVMYAIYDHSKDEFLSGDHGWREVAVFKDSLKRDFADKNPECELVRVDRL